MPSPLPARRLLEAAELERRLDVASRSALQLLTACSEHERELSQLRACFNKGANECSPRSEALDTNATDTIPQEERLTSKKAKEVISIDPPLAGAVFSDTAGNGPKSDEEFRPIHSSEGSHSMQVRQSILGIDEPLLPPDIIPLWAGEVDVKIHTFVNADHESHKTIRDYISQASHGAMRGGGGSFLGDNITSEGLAKWCILRPSSRVRVLFEVASLIVITWDLLTLPLSAFGFDKQGWAETLGQFTTGFWACDMFLNFFTGYHRSDGLTEMRLKKISSHYIRTWFVFDLSVVSLDIAMMLTSGALSGVADAARLGKTMRAVRIMRIFRMLRLVRAMKMLYLIEHVLDVIFSKSLLTFLNIFKLLGGLAMVTHFIACAWYAVGVMFGERHGWVKELVEEEASMPYRYVTSFHWSMAQFTPAPNNFHPTNFAERLYALCVLFLGLVLFSSLLGSVTALISQSKREAYAHLMETARLRDLFVKKHVSLSLGNRIMRYLSNSHRNKDTQVTEDDIVVLKTIPQSMLVELHYEMYSQVLHWHPLFEVSTDERLTCMSDICHMAIEERRLTKGDELFVFRERATNFYYVLYGTFQYYVGAAALTGIAEGKRGQMQLGHGRWLAEASLWCTWEHRGLLTASIPGSVVKVNADRFRLAVQKHPASLMFFRKYARHYACRLKYDIENKQVVDDTWRAFTTADDVKDALTNMAPEFEAVPEHLMHHQSMILSGHNHRHARSLVSGSCDGDSESGGSDVPSEDAVARGFGARLSARLGVTPPAFVEGDLPHASSRRGSLSSLKSRRDSQQHDVESGGQAPHVSRVRFASRMSWRRSG